MLYPIHEKGGYGYINHKGEIVVKPIYNRTSIFRNGTGEIDARPNNYERDGIYENLLVDAKGQKVFSIMAKGHFLNSVSISSISEDLLIVRMENTTSNSHPKSEYISRYYRLDGKLAFTNIYESAYDFSYGLASVKIDGKYGYIDKKGELVIENIFDSAFSFFTDNSAIVKYEGKSGVIDRFGQFLISPKYEFIYYYPDPHYPNSPLLLIAQKHKHGSEHFEKPACFCFVDINGQQAFPETFVNAMSFTDGLSLVKNESGKCGYINREGKLVIPYQFDRAEPFFEGLACVKMDDKWGYINRSGKVIVPAQFDVAYDFYEGRAKVKIGEKFGYIDKSGNLVIPIQFDSAEDFRGGLAYVGIGDEYGYIDKKGRFVWKAKREE